MLLNILFPVYFHKNIVMQITRQNNNQFPCLGHFPALQSVPLWANIEALSFRFLEEMKACKWFHRRYLGVNWISAHRCLLPTMNLQPSIAWLLPSHGEHCTVRTEADILCIQPETTVTCVWFRTLQLHVGHTNWEISILITACINMPSARQLSLVGNRMKWTESPQTSTFPNKQIVEL